jgi:hypothetical protein
MAHEDNVAYLNYLVRTYQAVTDVISATKSRINSLPGNLSDTSGRILKRAEHGSKLEDGLETIKGRLVRSIAKELPMWDIWEHWLKNVPGIGPPTAAELIMLYYYKHIPACPACMTEIEKREKEYYCPTCDKSVKGEGNLKYLLHEKDFPTISKWWAYMGRDIQDGTMRNRKKGVLSNWSPRGRKLGYSIGESFNYEQPTHKYKAVLLAEKAKYEKTQPDISQKWRHNKAKNNAVKLFLAHFWTIARTMDGKQVSEPYAMTIMGHTNYIKPFYYQE